MRASSESTSACAASTSACVDELVRDAAASARRERRRCASVEAHFAFVDAASRGLRLRLGQRQRRAQRRVVEPREHLAFADRHALLDVHFDDLAR